MSFRLAAAAAAAAFGLVGVVGALVAEHVADEEHQSAQDGEDHHRDDACKMAMRKVKRNILTPRSQTIQSV